jgi:hypothetical protein
MCAISSMDSSSGAGEEGQMRYALFYRGRIMIHRSGDLDPISSQPCRHWLYLVPKLNMPSTLIDGLRLILEHVDKLSLAKICCSCSQDIPYQNIRIERPSDSRVYQTLAQSTHLASRIRSFEIMDTWISVNGILYKILRITGPSWGMGPLR